MPPSAYLARSDRRLSLSGTVTYLTGASVAFTGAQAMDFSLSEGVGNGFLLGGAFSASCSLTLSDQDKRFTGGRTPYGAQVRVYLDAGEDRLPLAVFTVTKAVKREREPFLTLSGCDALGTAFEAAFQDAFDYPMTLSALAGRLAALVGFTLSDPLPYGSQIISHRPDWGDISLRQALAYTACAAGCFCCIDRSGDLRMKPVVSSAEPFVISPASTLRREYVGGRFGPLKGLIVSCKNAPRDASPLTFRLDDTPLNDYNALAVDRNPLFAWQADHTSPLAVSLLSSLSGLTMEQLKISWQGDPALTLGDRVRVIDTAGQAADTLVTRQTILFSRGFSMQSECACPVARPSVGRAFTSSGALNASLLDGAMSGVLIQDGTLSGQALMAGNVTAAQLAAGAVTAEKIAALAVSADKLAAGAVTADKIAAGAVEANQIAAGAVNAGHLAASTLEAVDARIGAADIDFAHVKDLTADEAIIESGLGGKLYIRRLAVNSGQMVDLTVGQLTVKAEDGHYYSLTVDLATGQVTAQRVQPTAAELEEGQMADTGQHIIETSLTVSDLNAGSAAAAEALIGKLFAGRLDVDTLFARQAAIDALTAADISGNQSLRLYVSSASSKTFSQWDDPALVPENSVRDGDLWNRTSGMRTWADVKKLTCRQAACYTWGDFSAGKQYVRVQDHWELLNDPNSKYTVRSGVDILPSGVEISGGRYVRIRTGGVFTVDSGNFTVDGQGNVSMKGIVEATEGGKIADWLIGAGLLHSGAGTGFVALDSKPTDTYAIWAGAENAESAPFRVARDGTVYVNKLVTLGETGGQSTVNLSNYPLWKLSYHGIRSYDANGITLTNGATINFNTAASAILDGVWSGSGVFTARVKDQSDTVVLTHDETFSLSAGTGSLNVGVTQTISSFNAAHKAHGYVAPDSVGAPLFVFNVDASGEYQNGVTDGAAAVTLSAGGWTNGTNTVTASNGKTASVSLPAFSVGESPAFVNHKKTVSFYTASVSAALATCLVDATSEYNAGKNSVAVASWSASQNASGITVYVTLSNGVTSSHFFDQ